MNPVLLALFSLLNPAHIEQLTADGLAEYATIAHGEGGLGKVAAAVAGLAKLLGDVAAGTAAPTTPPAA